MTTKNGAGRPDAEFGKCSSCPQTVRLNKDGRVRRHQRYNAVMRGGGRSSAACAGSGQAPKKAPDA